MHMLAILSHYPIPVTLASVGAAVVYALGSTGYGAYLLDSAIRRVTRPVFLRQDASAQSTVLPCRGERQVTDGGGAAILKTPSGWEIAVRGQQKTIPLGKDIYGSPQIIRHPKGFLSVMAKQVNETHFKVVAQLYGHQGNMTDEPEMSNPIRLNSAKPDALIRVIPFSKNQVAIAWQEAGHFLGRVIDAYGVYRGFHILNVSACEGAPMMKDFGNGWLGLSWVSAGGQSERVPHYLRVIDIEDNWHGSENEAIGSHVRSGSEPGIGNEKDRDLLPMGNRRFIYVWKQYLQNLSNAVQTISCSIYGSEGKKDCSFDVPGGEECSPLIVKAGRNRVSVICSRGEIFYDNAKKCFQRVTEGFKRFFTLPSTEE